MAYYLKFPADTGAPETNNKLVQLSGIATSGNVNIALEFAEDVVDPVTTLAKGAYLYDGRRTLDSTANGGGGYYLESNNAVEQSGTSNYRLNGVTADFRAWRTALADDVFSFDAGSQSDGVVSIGARFNQTEHMPLLALKSITITDSNGTHIVDMSSSNGTADTFTSLDGIVTLKLFGFTGGQWVFYSTGGGSYTLNADGGAYSYSGGPVSLRLNRSLQAAGGTYSYAGGVATLAYTPAGVSYTLNADGGLFSYSGGNAALRLNRKLQATGGAYSYSGGNAGLSRGYKVNASGGIYGYSGGAAALDYVPATGYTLAALGASFSYAGGDATFNYSQTYPQAVASDFTVTGRLSDSANYSAIMYQSTTYGGRLN